MFLIAALLAAAQAGAADWRQVAPESGYWVDMADVHREGDRRRFTLRVELGAARSQFGDSADCRAGTTDVRKFEFHDSEGRDVMLFVDPTIERKLLALVCG